MVDFVERSPKDPGKRSKPKPPPPASGRPKPKKIHEADLQVKCDACGHTFGVLAALAGSETACPGCSKPVQVPKANGGLKKPDDTPTKRNKPKPAPDPFAKKDKASDTPGEGEKKPSIRKERPKFDLKTQPKCPECEVVLEPDAVLCINCGYDLRNKQQKVISRKKRLNPIIPVVVLLALVGGSYAVYEFVLKPKDDPPEAVPETVAEVASEPEPVVATEPAPVVEPVPEAKPEPPPAPPAEDPREDVKQLMAAKLDKQYPVAAVGDTVTLTALDGTEYTGALTALEATTIRLRQDGNDVMLELKNLERRSRARLDIPYRNAMVDQLTDTFLARKAAE